MTTAGGRLLGALKEVLADVRGERPLPVVAVFPDKIDVQALRRKTGMSQAVFAATFGVNRRTLQDWEQGRYAPDPMARAFLTVIAKEPEAVKRALG